MGGWKTSMETMSEEGRKDILIWIIVTIDKVILTIDFKRYNGNLKQNGIKNSLSPSS